MTDAELHAPPPDDHPPCPPRPEVWMVVWMVKKYGVWDMGMNHFNRSGTAERANAEATALRAQGCRAVEVVRIPGEVKSV